MDKQSTDAQVLKLREIYPDAEVISEKISGRKQRKPQLDALVAKLQAGDTLVVYSLDRLGRDVLLSLQLIRDLLERKIIIKTLRESFDYDNFYSRAMIQMMLVFAELERNLMSERLRAKIAVVKRDGGKWGRESKVPLTTVENARDDVANGLSVPNAAIKYGISRRHMYKLLETCNAAAGLLTVKSSAN